MTVGVRSKKTKQVHLQCFCPSIYNYQNQQGVTIVVTFCKIGSKQLAYRHKFYYFNHNWALQLSENEASSTGLIKLKYNVRVWLVSFSIIVITNKCLLANPQLWLHGIRMLCVKTAAKWEFEVDSQLIVSELETEVNHIVLHIDGAANQQVSWHACYLQVPLSHLYLISLNYHKRKLNEVVFL